MAYRRRRQPALPDPSERHAPNSMDFLAFKYMETCKVESSTDSDSEISPRWSDTSTMGCVSSAPESGTFRRTLPLTYKPAGRHGCYSLFLDPYDGSSEDSDESNANTGITSRRPRQQGKGGGGSCRFSGRSRRLTLHHSASLREAVKHGMRDPPTEQQHLLDVPMKCGSDSELWVCELDIVPSQCGMDGCGDLEEEMANDPTTRTTNQTMNLDLRCQFYDSGSHATRSSTPQTSGPVTPVGGSWSQMLDSSPERSPSPANLRSFFKRKLGLPGADVVELGQRKRQCVFNMEGEQGSASEPC